MLSGCGVIKSVATTIVLYTYTDSIKVEDRDWLHQVRSAVKGPVYPLIRVHFSSLYGTLGRIDNACDANIYVGF